MAAPEPFQRVSTCRFPCRFIYEKAHELGVKSIILDGPDSWAQSLQDEGKIEKFVPVDFADAESAFDRCVAAINKVKSVSAMMSVHPWGSVADHTLCNSESNLDAVWVRSPAHAFYGASCNASVTAAACCSTWCGRSSAGSGRAGWHLHLL